MLDVNFGAVITQAVGFILLVLFMGLVVYPRITTTIDARTQSIAADIERAVADKTAMEGARREYEQRLAGVEAEARERINTAVHQAQAEAAAILATAREEATEQRDRALSEIDMERKKAIAEIRAQMADLAVVAASKVLEREITPAVHRELIHDFIRDVSARS